MACLRAIEEASEESTKMPGTPRLASFGAWKAQIGVSFSAEAASLNGGRSPPDTGAIAAHFAGRAAARFHVPMEPWLRPVRYILRTSSFCDATSVSTSASILSATSLS